MIAADRLSDNPAGRFPALGADPLARGPPRRERAGRGVVDTPGNHRGAGDGPDRYFAAVAEGVGRANRLTALTMDPNEAVEHAPVPAAQALSNGRLTTVLTAAGGGWTRQEGLPLARWAPDPWTGGDASALFVRDLDGSALWSLGQVPGAAAPEAREAELEGGRVTVRRRDGGIESTLEVCVSPFEDVEVRRLTLVNPGSAARRLDVTSYAELFQDAPPTGLRGWLPLPAETEFVPRFGALIVCRPGGPDDDPLWVAHVLRPVRGAFRSTVEVESTRGRFLGAAGPLVSADALRRGVSLSGAVGRARDPVVSLRRGLHLPGRASAGVVSVLATGRSRDDVEALARRYALTPAADDDFAAAGERALNLLADLRIPEGWAQRIPELTGALLLGDGEAAAPELEELGLMDGAPLVLAEGAEREPLAAAITLGAYWRRQALAVNVLALARDAAEAEALHDLAAGWPAPRGLGGTFVRVASELPQELERGARAAARLRLS